MEMNKFILIPKDQFDKFQEFQRLYSPGNIESVLNLRKDIQSKDIEGIKEKQSISVSPTKDLKIKVHIAWI